jgi:flagellar motor switch protein FliN/FliY
MSHRAKARPKLKAVRLGDMSDILSKEELDALLSEVRRDEPEDELPAAPPTPTPAPETAAPAPEPPNLRLILEIPVELRVELGRTRMTVHEVLQLGQGSVIELDRLANDPIDLTLNGRAMAQGDAVVVNENFGMRILEVDSVRDRIRKL